MMGLQWVIMGYTFRLFNIAIENHYFNRYIRHHKSSTNGPISIVKLPEGNIRLEVVGHPTQEIMTPIASGLVPTCTTLW